MSASLSLARSRMADVLHLIRQETQDHYLIESTKTSMYVSVSLLIVWQRDGAAAAAAPLFFVSLLRNSNNLLRK